MPAEARLRVRALRAFRVLVNGEPVPGARSDGSRWRDTTELDVARWLRPGANQLAVEVENPTGPGLLSLRLDGPGLSIASGPDWQVTLDGGRVALAGLADDTRRSAAALAVETPAEALRRSLGRGGAALRGGRGGFARAAQPRLAAPAGRPSPARASRSRSPPGRRSSRASWSPCR